MSEEPETLSQPTQDQVNKQPEPKQNMAGGDIPTPKTQEEQQTQPPLDNIGENSDPAGKSKKKMGVLFSGCILLLMAFALLIGLIGLIGYGKISLPDKTLQESVEYNIQNLPFMPKTPKYLIMKSASVHTDISSANIDLSASVNSNASELSEILGSDSFDIKVTGPVDLSDPEKPLMSLNAQVSKLFDFDLIVKEETSYIKINEIPMILFSFMGITPDMLENNPITDRWVSYDLTGLDSSAKDALDEKMKEKSSADNIAEEKLLSFLNEELIDLMVVSDDEVDGYKTTKITLTLDKDEIAELSTQLEEIFETSNNSNAYSANEFSTVEELEISLWIDKDNYYLRKTVVTGTIAYGLPGGMGMYPGVLGAKDYLAILPKDGTDSGMIPEQDMPYPPETNYPPEEDTDYEVNFAMAINLSNFGETFDIKTPEPTIDAETYIAEVSMYIQELMYRQYEDEFENDDFTGFSDSELDSYMLEESNGFDELETGYPTETESFVY